MSSSDHVLKLVVIGDGAIGKTCLIFVYSKGEFPESYVPTVVDNFTISLKIDGKDENVNIWDTAGQETFDKIRLLSYPDSDIFLVCFSVANVSSLQNIEARWYSEIQQHNTSKAPIMLVGLQSDLRTDPEYQEKMKEEKQKYCTMESIENVKKYIGAVKYVECSAIKNENVKTVFSEAIRCARSFKKPKKSQNKGPCTLL
eukprot:gene2498-3204_t